MNKNLNIAFKLLNDFNNFVNDRSLLFLWSKEVLPKTLEWHFLIWEKEHNLLEEEKYLEKWSQYSELSNVLDSILRNIEERCFKEGKAHAFFRLFEEHAEMNKKKATGKDKKFEYVVSLFEIFYQMIFKLIDTESETHDIWFYFPKDWKITKSNLLNNENIISRVSWLEFHQWIVSKIIQSSKIYDLNLDEMVNNLFPEVDPVIWSKISIFFSSAYDVGQAVEIPWNIGNLGRIRETTLTVSEEEPGKISVERDEKEEKEEKEKTYELAVFLFKEQFSEKKLEEYLNELESLNYPGNSQKERKKLTLQHILKEMLEYVKQQKSPGQPGLW